MHTDAVEKKYYNILCKAQPLKAPYEIEQVVTFYDIALDFFFSVNSSICACLEECVIIVMYALVV